MTIRSFSQFFVAALLTASYPYVRAATVQYNYGPVRVNFLGGPSVNTPLQGFNPALGTLDSINLSYSATAILLEGDALSTRIGIDDGTALLATISFPLLIGRVEQTETGTFTVPISDWTDFETAGTVDLTSTPFTACRGSAPTPSGCEAFEGRESGTVTYTYTPPVETSTVPEPGTIAFFAAGLMGISLAARSPVGGCRFSRFVRGNSCDFGAYRSGRKSQ
ncbi:MAG TPA: PEP-CTERM sorting domain-containing protein [Bryobacteraceae bacterium]|nr:PEP-CTERM sorting domain-containing protein [Bryobacteraceae bacterium]